MPRPSVRNAEGTARYAEVPLKRTTSSETGLVDNARTHIPAPPAPGRVGDVVTCPRAALDRKAILELSTRARPIWPGRVGHEQSGVQGTQNGCRRDWWGTEIKNGAV